MKAIQVTFDERLLEKLDSLPAVRQRGRSAVLREATTEYLRRLESAEIDRRYAKGYGGSDAIQTELRGWGQEGAWPED